MVEWLKILITATFLKNEIKKHLATFWLVNSKYHGLDNKL